jgi:acetate kinase
VEVNPALNDQSRQDADISAEGAGARTLVVRAREDLEIARQARAALAGERP